jgi:fluoroacetyl-CoA thioesterase
MEVEVHVKLIEIDGNRTKWEIVAKDEVDEIGRGTHDRFSVNFDRFNARVAKKANP